MTVLYSCSWFSAQVSVLILEKYEPPTLVCAITKVLTEIRDASSAVPTLIVPFVGMSSKLKWESTTSVQNDAKFSHYSVQIGPETEISRAIATRTQKPPASLQIHYEPLACFLHLVHVLNLPASILIGKRGDGLSDKAAGKELEVVYLWVYSWWQSLESLLLLMYGTLDTKIFYL